MHSGAGAFFRFVPTLHSFHFTLKVASNTKNETDPIPLGIRSWWDVDHQSYSYGSDFTDQLPRPKDQAF